MMNTTTSVRQKEGDVEGYQYQGADQGKREAHWTPWTYFLLSSLRLLHLLDEEPNTHYTMDRLFLTFSLYGGGGGTRLSWHEEVL